MFAVSYGNEVSSNHTLRGKNVFIAINTHDSHCISLNICSHINTLKANFFFFVFVVEGKLLQQKVNLVSNLDFSGFVFLLPNANQAH